MVDIPIQSPYAFCQFDGLKILLHHGHVLNDEAVLKLASHWNYGIAVSGHTHITRLEQKNRVVFLNPGSHSLPKGDGVPTVARIEKKGEMTTIDVIDFQGSTSLKTLVMGDKKFFMAKGKTIFSCQSCVIKVSSGSEMPRVRGWNTLIEELVEPPETPYSSPEILLRNPPLKPG